MVDIAMCKRRDCPDRKTCFRYLAMEGEMQSYIMFNSPTISKDTCDHYWQCRNAKELAYMNRLNRD